MRVATWNLNRATWNQRKKLDSADAHARAAWDELSSLEVDIAMLQEAMPPPEGVAKLPVTTLPVGRGREDWRSLPGPARWWCSAIAAWSAGLEQLSEEGRAEPLYVSQKGAYAVGVVRRNEKPLAVASVYALWDYGWLPHNTKPRYAHTSLHRAISDLTPVLDTDHSEMSVVIAGDFNTSSQFEAPHREAFRTVDDRLRGLGLRNVSIRPDGEILDGCPCIDEICRHVQTLEGPVPYQDDYIYVSEDLVASARFARVERSDRAASVSDHFPLIVEIDS